MDKFLIIAIIGLLLGFSIQYWIYRRKFYRRGPSGGEGFSSFEKSVFTRFFEQILKWISYVFIIIGILYLWRYSRQTNQNETSTKKSIEKIK